MKSTFPSLAPVHSKKKFSINFLDLCSLPPKKHSLLGFPVAGVVFTGILGGLLRGPLLPLSTVVDCLPAVVGAAAVGLRLAADRAGHYCVVLDDPGRVRTLRTLLLPGGPLFVRGAVEFKVPIGTRIVVFGIVGAVACRGDGGGMRTDRAFLRLCILTVCQ